MSEPLITQEYVFFCLNEQKNAFDGNFESIKNNSIGAVNATSYGSRFDTVVKNGEIPKIDIGANDFTQNFMKLTAGRVDIIVSSKSTGLDIIKNLGIVDKVKISGPVIETTYSYLAFTKKKDYTALAVEFDKILIDFKKDGTFDSFRKK